MAAAEAEKTEEPKAKSINFKMVVIVASILLVEAAAVVAVMVFIAGPPKVEASMMSQSEVTGDERIVETLVLHAKLPNSRTGVTFLYDTEIYVQTEERFAGQVSRELEQFHNEIRAAISAIWRTAEPHHFQEPNLESLNRNVYALLSKRFGTAIDAEEPIIRKCVIVMGTGFRIDS